MAICHLINSAIEAQDDRVRQCECHSTCSTKKCSCKEVEIGCTAFCHCGTKKKACRNNKTVPNPDDSDKSEELHGDDDSTDEGRGAPRKRSRHVVDDDSLHLHMDRLRLADRLIKDFVNGLAVDALKRVCIDLLRRSLGAYSDYVSMGMQNMVGPNVDQAYEKHIRQIEQSSRQEEKDYVVYPREPQQTQNIEERQQQQHPSPTQYQKDF